MKVTAHGTVGAGTERRLVLCVRCRDWQRAGSGDRQAGCERREALLKHDAVLEDESPGKAADASQRRPGEQLTERQRLLEVVAVERDKVSAEREQV